MWAYGWQYLGGGRGQRVFPIPKQTFLIWLRIKPPISLSVLMISSLSQRWLLPLVKWELRRMTLEAIATSHLVITAVPGNLSALPNPTPMMHLPQVLPSSQSFPLGLLHHIRIVSWVWLWMKNMSSLFFSFVQNVQLKYKSKRCVSKNILNKLHYDLIGSLCPLAQLELRESVTCMKVCFPCGLEDVDFFLQEIREDLGKRGGFTWKHTEKHSGSSNVTAESWKCSSLSARMGDGTMWGPRG